MPAKPTPRIAPIATDLILAFAAGFVTLGVEMAGGRVLTPFFGSSLYQWAALIGVALSSYSLGYLGHERLCRFGAALPLAVSAVFLFVVPLWIVGALETFLSLPLLPSSILCSFLTIGPPSVLLASLTPHLQERALASSSRASFILAASTLGSLAGVFGVAFYLVPGVGLSKTFFALGLLSAAAAGLAASGLKGTASLAAAIIVLPIILVLLWLVPAAAIPSTLARFEVLSPSLPIKQHLQLVEAKETSYQSYSLWRSGDPASPTLHFYMNGLEQFVWNEQDAAQAPADYFHYADHAFDWTADPERAKGLFIGLGGGLVPYLVQRRYRNAELTVVELDADVADVAWRELPISRLARDAPRPKLVVDDGRRFLRMTREKYDYIFIDAYVGTYVPHHLCTIEFFQSVRDHLSERGVVAINMPSIFEHGGVLDRFESTVHAVFPNTIGVEVAGTYNLMIFAFRDRFPNLPANSQALVDRVFRAQMDVRRKSWSKPYTDDRDEIDASLFEVQSVIFAAKRQPP